MSNPPKVDLALIRKQLYEITEYLKANVWNKEKPQEVAVQAGEVAQGRKADRGDAPPDHR